MFIKNEFVPQNFIREKPLSFSGIDKVHNKIIVWLKVF